MAEAALAAIKVASAWLAKKGLAQAVVKFGLQLAASAVVSKLVTPSTSRNQGLLIQTDLSAESPRRVQVGKRLSGGVFVDWVTKGDINEDTWRIFYLGEGPMGNVTKILADGREVYTGTLSHGQEVTLTALDSRVRVRYYDGRPGQTADANLIASSVGWTSNHVGTGCAYVVVYARFHDTKLVVPPDMSFEVEGAKLYDRRLDSTAGGSGSHRLKDPTTWALSSNPAVALDHYLLGRFLSASDDEPWFGVGLNPEIVPYADFAALANLCDEQVDLKLGGTQDRYSMNGFIFADEIFRDVIRRICDHMNARPADFGGLISVIDGEAKTPVLTLDKSDAIDESAEVYKPKLPYVQIVGGVEGRYQDPANNYQPTDYPRYTESAWKAEDGGETKYVTRDFDYEVNQERAERLASLYAKRGRRQATLSGVYPISALVLEEGDWFTRTGGKFGAGKVFEVVGSPVLDVETMTVAIQSIEVDPTDSAWDETNATDQAAAPDAAAGAPVVAVPNVVITAVDVNSGGVQIPGLRFKNNDYQNDPPVSVEVEVAENDGSDGPEGDRQTMFLLKEQHFGIMTGLLPSRGYVARWRGRLGELESAWSSWTAVTTTAGYAVGSASSVPWSGVSDDGGRPDDNADVTGNNVAAAIEDQGEWATSPLGESDILRSRSGASALNANPYFSDPRSGNGVLFAWSNWANANQINTVSRGSAGGVVASASARAAGLGNLGARQTLSPINPSGLYKMRIQCRRTGGTYAGAGLLIQWRDASDNHISEDKISCVADAPTSGVAAQAYHDGIVTWEKVVIAPANAVKLFIYAMWSWEGMPGYTATDSDRFEGEFHEASFKLAGETDRRTNTQEDGANVTGNHVAAAIDGQDYGATASESEVSNNIIRSEAQRPNLIPAEYQLFGEGDGLSFVVISGAISGTGVKNPFLNRDARRFTSDGSNNFMIVRFTPANSQTNMTLPPARYAFKVAVRTDDTFDDMTVRLRDASNSIKYAGSPIARSGADPHIIEGVLDLRSETATTDYYFEIVFGLTSAISGKHVWVYRLQLEAIPDDAAGPGDWSDHANDYLLSIERGADVTGAHIAAGIEDQGDLATANRASRRAFTQLSTTTPGIAFSNSEFSVGASDQVTLIRNIWSEVASIAIQVDGSPVELEMSAIFGEAAPGTTTESPELKVKARIKRNGTVISDGRTLANLRADGVTDTTRNLGGVDRIVDFSPGSSGTNTYTLELATPATQGKSPLGFSACVNPNVPSHFAAVIYESDANTIAT